MNERVNPFAILTEAPPAFTPKVKAEKPVPKDAIEKIAEANNFPSRQAAKPAPVRRKQRRFRTGRDQHLGIKATAETRERFYKAADERNVQLGELLRMAIDALERAGVVTAIRVSGRLKPRDNKGISGVTKCLAVRPEWRFERRSMKGHATIAAAGRGK
jgi:hypothetical protein